MTTDAPETLEEEIERRLKLGDTLMSARDIAELTGQNQQTILKDWPNRVEVGKKSIRWWRADVIKRLAEVTRR